MQENKPPELGSYGRGGAGNYRTPESEKSKKEKKDTLEAKDKADQKVVRDMEIGLKEPEKAHLGKEGLEYDTRRKSNSIVIRTPRFEHVS